MPLDGGVLSGAWIMTLRIYKWERKPNKMVGYAPLLTAFSKPYGSTVDLLDIRAKAFTIDSIHIQPDGDVDIFVTEKDNAQ